MKKLDPRQISLLCIIAERTVIEVLTEYEYKKLTKELTPFYKKAAKDIVINSNKNKLAKNILSWARDNCKSTKT